MRHQQWFTSLVLVVMISLFGALNCQAADEEVLQRLEEIINEQQVQIDAQAESIQGLENKVEHLSGQQDAPADPQVAGQEEAAREAVVTEATETVETGAAPLNENTGVRTGNDFVKVQLYGQVNKGVLVSDDGNEQSFFVVDNSHSSTRFGLLGSVDGAYGLSAGTRIEVQFATNPSIEVNQVDQNGVGSNNFTKRHFDLWFESKHFGKLYIGHGSTASDGSSEVDLSGTAVIGYSSIIDLAGGHFFYDSGASMLSTTTVMDVFDNMDGLGRDDRIRYDSPAFYGFEAGASALSGGGGDITVNYAGKSDSFAFGAAAAYVAYGAKSDAVDIQFNGSASVLHLSTGFNLTLAGGRQTYEVSGRNDGEYYYGKFGYRKDFFQVGETAMAIDYTMSKDIDQNDDEFTSYGLLFVQQLERLGSEYYLGLRNHSLSRQGQSLKDVNAILTGFRVKF